MKNKTISPIKINQERSLDSSGSIMWYLDHKSSGIVTESALAQGHNSNLRRLGVLGHFDRRRMLIGGQGSQRTLLEQRGPGHGCHPSLLLHQSLAGGDGPGQEACETCALHSALCVLCWFP